MLKSTAITEYIILGKCYRYLSTLGEYVPGKELSKMLNAFITTIDKCELSATKAAAESLRSFNIVVHQGLETVHRDSISSLKTMMATVESVMDHEASSRHAITLNTTGVSPRLRKLPTELSLSESQTHLLDETIRCLECESYRAAIVMGWNLAFDFIRQWAFDIHLAAFNGELATYTKKGGASRYRPITTYEDFFQPDPPGERTVLDILYDINVVTEIPFNELCRHLRYRNNYAHPNFRLPTASKANAYIEELIDIITGPPFK